MKGILMRVFTVIALAALAFAPAVAAGKGGASRPADDSAAVADFSRDVIVWEPMVEFRRATLRVAGQSGVFERSFESGEAIYFDFIDAAGNRLLDGSYSYELTFSPVVEASREDGAGIEARDSAKHRMTQSGYFTLVDGMAALPDLNEEGISFRTSVDTMDRIIQGSLCVGFDCVSGESFGFDTVRLKENNLRVHFLDTSNTASFPSNDWRLVANDSTNGGANKFTIEDSSAGRNVFTIEGGALSNSLYVDDGGRIGRKTSTPVVEFHIVDGDTPTVRLEQDGSSGFTPQTWDVAGNETNFFIRDVTNGSTLPLRIRPGAPTSALDIAADGDVGIGTASPTSKLHVIGDSDSGSEIEAQHAGPTQLELNNTSVGVSWVFNNNNSLRISDAGDADVEWILDTAGNLTLTGTITVPGGTLPDYVFEPDYPLMSLDELEEFIKAEKHLPNVPSAAEVKKTGVNMTSMQMKLLEKVEELTLYILDQEKAMGELQARLAVLEQAEGKNE